MSIPGVPGVPDVGALRKISTGDGSAELLAKALHPWPDVMRRVGFQTDDTDVI